MSEILTFSSYDDVRAALREPALWPVAPRKTKNFKIPDETAQQALRVQVMNAFSPARLNEWQRRIETQPKPPGGSIDLVSEFAEPWCVVAAEIVTGSAPADRESLLAAARIVSRAAAEPMDEELRKQATQADAELEEYFRGAAIPMPGPTFVALARTTACLLASGWLALLQHPAELARLGAQPDLIPRAIEEILRYARIPESVFRYASSPVTLCGHDIPGDDRIKLELGLANRDPQVFPEPDRFDILRRGPSHLALGFGPHACAGGALIRMVATAASVVFIQCFGDAVPIEPVEWVGGSGFRSPRSLRVA